MGNLWLRIKIWTKVVVFALFMIYVIVFVAKNSSRQVQFWFWHNHEPTTTVLLLALYAFLSGVIGAILVRTTFRTIQQVSELQRRTRTEKIEREILDMRTKATMLRSKPDPNTVIPPSSDSLPPDAAI